MSKHPSPTQLGKQSDSRQWQSRCDDHVDVPPETINAVGLDETYGTYVGDAHDYSDDTSHDSDDDNDDGTDDDTNDDTDDDADDGGRGNL